MSIAAPAGSYRVREVMFRRVGYPRRRLAWPEDASSPAHSLLDGVLDGITIQFARAESGDRNLLVLTPGDARQAVPKTLREAVTSMGANLVLGAELRQQSSLDLRV